MTWAKQEKLGPPGDAIPSDVAPFEGLLFGTAVALSADEQILVVGAPYDAEVTRHFPQPFPAGTSSNPSVPCGAAFVYRRLGDGWDKIAKLLPTSFQDIGPPVLFGNAVAVNADGTTIAVAQSGSITYTDPGTHLPVSVSDGAVTIYVREGVGVDSEAFIPTPRPDEGGRFAANGLSLSADGNVLAVDDSDTNGFEGEAYIWQRSSGWTPEVPFQTLPGESDHEAFGSGITLTPDGLQLFLNTGRGDGIGSDDLARLQVLTRASHDDVFVLLTEVEDPDIGGVTFGGALAVSDDGTILASASQIAVAWTKVDVDAWLPFALTEPYGTAVFFCSTSRDGGEIVSTKPYVAADPGSAEIWTPDDNDLAWSEEASLAPDDAVGDAQFGAAVRLVDRVLIVGGPHDQVNIGAVWVYVNPGILPAGTVSLDEVSWRIA